MLGPQPSTVQSARLLAIGLLIAAFMTGCSGTQDAIRFAPEVNTDEAHAQRVADPNEPYWSYRLAEYALQTGNATGATAHLDTALTLDPSYAPAVTLLSKTWYDVGDFQKAATLLNNHLEQHPDAPDAMRVALALNLQAMAQPDESATVLAACSTKSDIATTARTFVALQSEDFLSSLEDAEQAVQDNPNSAANHNNLGISLLYAGQPNEAREAFKRALALEPELPGGLYNMAIVENFYFFDPTASNAYFAQYREVTKGRPMADPDDLGTLLGYDAQTAANFMGAPND